MGSDVKIGQISHVLNFLNINSNFYFLRSVTNLIGVRYRAFFSVNYYCIACIIAHFVQYSWSSVQYGMWINYVLYWDLKNSTSKSNVIVNNGDEDYIKQRSSYSLGTRVAEFYNIEAKCPGNCMILHFDQISVLVILMADFFT